MRELIAALTYCLCPTLAIAVYMHSTAATALIMCIRFLRLQETPFLWWW
jgi:hypothetical protein